MVCSGAEVRHVDVAVHDGILKIMYRVCNIVRKVHHLRFDAANSRRRTPAHPFEDFSVVGVETEFRPPARIIHGLRKRPGILRARIETCPRQVEAARDTLCIEDLGLEPRENPKGLRVTLEPTDVRRPIRQRPLAVVTEGWMTNVVGQARRVDHVGV